jgi:hypothetical protein
LARDLAGGPLYDDVCPAHRGFRTQLHVNQNRGVRTCDGREREERNARCDDNASSPPRGMHSHVGDTIGKPLNAACVIRWLLLAGRTCSNFAMIQGERDYDPDKGVVTIIIDVTLVRGYGAESPIEQSISVPNCRRVLDPSGTNRCNALSCC